MRWLDLVRGQTCIILCTITAQHVENALQYRGTLTADLSVSRNHVRRHVECKSYVETVEAKSM